MKTIGLIGGISAESTAIYYQLLNRYAREALGGMHSAELLLWSFDFAKIADLQAAGDWQSAGRRMVEAAQTLERGGAECLVICANTMHRMAGEIQEAVTIPLIHIADATAQAIRKTPATSPLLLATRYTMEQDFYTGRLRERHGIEVRVPDDTERTIVHDIIYRELCQGQVRPESRAAIHDIIQHHRQQGADSIILGCTEVGLLITQASYDCPVFDTADIHARAAIHFALLDP
jgi:aspartate racemase